MKSNFLCLKSGQNMKYPHDISYIKRVWTIKTHDSQETMPQAVVPIQHTQEDG